MTAPKKTVRPKYGENLTNWQKIRDIMSPFVFIFMAMFAATVFILLILNAISGLGFDAKALQERFPGMTIYVSLLFYAITLLMHWKVMKLDNERFGQTEGKWKSLPMIFSVVLTLCLAGLWSHLLLSSPLVEIFGKGTTISSTDYQGINLILMIISSVLLGPLVEEMIFRGLILRRTQNYLGRTAGIVISSLLFGIYHANVIQFIYAAVLGCVLALIYLESESFRLVVLAHAAANLWNIISSWIQEAAPGAGVPLRIAEAVLGAACLCFLLLSLKKGGKKVDPDRADN